VESGTHHQRRNAGNAEARISDGKGEKGLDKIAHFFGAIRVLPSESSAEAESSSRDLIRLMRSLYSFELEALKRKFISIF
jgi:hypothetical protein